MLTVNANSLWDMLRGTQKVSGPPRYTTWSWPAATRSIGALAALEPQVLATGHGKPLATAAAPALQTLADQLNAAARQRAISPSHAHRGVQGFFGRVDYSARARYRRPPKAYRRLQWLGFVLTTLGLSPRYVVTLEVPGRHSGLIRRTSLVQVTCGGAHHLVALAGESEWVRNVRAAGGRVVIGRRRRRAATLIEVPPPDRPPVIRAYLLRAGRRAGSRRWPARPATTSG